MAINQIDPKTAYEKTNDDTGSCPYIDVRTPEEFAAGHPKGALNIPAFLHDGVQMAANPDFVKLVQEKFKAEDEIIVGCQMGGRSQRACETLELAGYKNINNVQGGYGGKKDPMGNVIQAGWQDLGLPIEKQNC